MYINYGGSEYYFKECDSGSKYLDKKQYKINNGYNILQTVNDNQNNCIRCDVKKARMTTYLQEYFLSSTETVKDYVTYNHFFNCPIVNNDIDARNNIYGKQW